MQENTTELMRFVPFFLFQAAILGAGIVIAKKRKYSIVSAIILLLIPLVNIFALIYIASKNDQSREKSLLICSVVGFVLAAIQRFVQVSSIDPLSSALFKSLVFGLVIGLVYAMPLWLSWRLWSQFSKTANKKEAEK